MIRMQIGGLEVTLFSLRNSSRRVKEAIAPALIAGGKAYKARVRRRINLRDHSLADLAKKDHPYAVRHGSIRIHRKKPWGVHRQSGRMINALVGSELTSGGMQGYEVTFDYSAAPHAVYVLQGTKVMLPRDTLWQTAIDPVTHNAMMKRIVKTLGKKLRSQLGVRFGSTTPDASFGASGGASAVR